MMAGPPLPSSSRNRSPPQPIGRELSLAFLPVSSCISRRIRLLMQELTGRKASDSSLPIGWGGDRFRLDEGNGGPAIIWVSVWDEPRHRDWFLAATGQKFKARVKPGFR